jgi:hypothetical protein
MMALERPAMLIRRNNIGLLILIGACTASLADGWAADTTAKAVPSDAPAVAAMSAPSAKARYFKRSQAFRRQAAFAPYRTCTYLGCPGHLILGIGF